MKAQTGGNHMRNRTLGGDLTVSAIGLGCMGFSHAYGAPTERSEAIRQIQQAVDMGYTFFDTAEVYGTPDDPHQNEMLVGEALAACRDKVVVATKFGIRFDMTSTQVNKSLVPDSRPEVIRASVDASLKRLRTDHIDLYSDRGSRRCDVGFNKSGKNHPLGTFGGRRRNHSPRARGMPDYGNSEPLFHDDTLA